MDTWIELAKGPLFRVSLAVCLLGLAYRLGTVLWQIRSAHARAGDKTLPVDALVRNTVAWLLPLRLLRHRPLYGLASFVFHAGVLGLPLFYTGHVGLWGPLAPAWWPRLAAGPSDVLTLAALVGLVTILFLRLLSRPTRDLTRGGDVGVLLLLFAVVGTGWWAAHPLSSPAAPRLLMLLHVLAGDLALIITPITKIVHCVLAPLSQLIGEIGWRFPADSGKRVAVALAKENEPI